jgi:hypothetical protein
VMDCVCGLRMAVAVSMAGTCSAFDGWPPPGWRAGYKCV